MCAGGLLSGALISAASRVVLVSALLAGALLSTGLIELRQQDGRKRKDTKPYDRFSSYHAAPFRSLLTVVTTPLRDRVRWST